MAEDSLAALLAYLDTLLEPHIVCSADYRIVGANRAYRDGLAGSEEVVGRRCYEVSHHYTRPCDEAGESCPLKRSLQSGQRERVLHLHHTPNGEAYVAIELAPVKDAAGRLRWFVEKLEPLGRTHGGKRSNLIGRSPAFQRMLELVARVASSDVTVMLLGESGVGKEVVAHAIHEGSRRAERPFIAVDCSGLTETLFESELFGHEKGAFTGAVSRRIGLVEAAAGGTLFLDELGDIPLGMQVKLLRLIEAGVFRRVGGNEFLKADVRLISATHRDLRRMIGEGQFRQDLYYRLNTFPIVVPALRERREDIPLLASVFLERLAPGRKMRLSESALLCLMAYDYPGNVRELRNVIERAILLADGDIIEPRHLPDEVQLAVGPPDQPDDEGAGHRRSATLAAIEQALLKRRLSDGKGSRKALAAELGISERTLYRRLKQLRQSD